MISLIPTVAVLAVYLLGAVVGWDTLDSGTLFSAILAAPIAIVLASVSASLGEEPGWRGFLWPLMRERWGFLLTSLVMAIIWWAFHVPVILLGWYGDLARLPAFTVAIIGFTLFVGVITDRSRAVWPAFGWLAAVASLAVGVVATLWHIKTMGGPLPAPGTESARVPAGSS